MASSYSTLKLELIAVGETGSTGNWGTTTNNNLGDTTSTTRGIEQAIGGFSAVTLTTTSTTLAYTNTTANQDFRSLFLSFSGSPGAASTVIIPSTSIQKLYIIKNSISGGYSLTVKYASSTGTVVPNGSTVILYANGTDVIPGQDYIPALTLGSALPVTSGGTGVTTSTGTGSVVLSAAPTLTSPSLSAETFSTSASVTAGTNAQGQGALTSDYNVITTAAANPSGVTLPAATTGRRVVVVNKGANPINVYPATSAYIDGNAINTSIQIIVNGVMIFNASSATQWYSSYNLMTPSSTGAVNSFSAGSTGLTPNTASTGNIVLAGTLGIGNGGTNATTANAAFNNLVPSQTSNSGKYLTTDGTNTSWGSVASQVYPGAGIANSTGSAWGTSYSTTGSGTVVALATSPSLTTPSLSGETFSTAATVTAGTNAQGQGALTNDYNVITTAASNPSGVTLPTATTGRRIVIVNKGANAVNVYPASSGFIDALAINTSIQIAVNGVMEFNASTTLQWYSSYNLYTSATAAAGVTSFSAGTTGFTPSSATPGAITLSGTLNAANGGTGQSSYTVGDIIYASGSTALSKLADVATGNALISGGVGVAPSWGKIGLTTHVTGTLPAGNGGTGQSSYNIGDILYASGATTLSSLADVAAGNALISGGVNQAPTWGKVGLTTHVTGTLPVLNGGTGTTTNTGTGSLVLSNSPTLVTPVLGTPTSGTLSNCDGLPLSTGVVGTLPVANGGTGASSLTANNVLLGNGTSAVQVVAPSTAGNVLTSDGTTWASSAPAITGFSNMSTAVYPTTVTNSSGSAMSNTGTGTFTFTVPSNTTKVKVTVVGGGGGGGGAAAAGSTYSGNGGGSGVAIKVITGLVSGTLSITVGAGGTAGAAGNNAGGSGGTSSVASGTNNTISTVSSTGGGGGSGASGGTGTGGTSGAGSGGDLNFTGSAGQSGGTGGFAGTNILSSPVYFSGTTGVAGNNYGGGGGGATGGLGSAKAGGAGAVGLIIIEY